MPPLIWSKKLLILLRSFKKKPIWIGNKNFIFTNEQLKRGGEDSMQEKGVHNFKVFFSHFHFLPLFSSTAAADGKKAANQIKRSCNNNKKHSRMYPSC